MKDGDPNKPPVGAAAVAGVLLMLLPNRPPPPLTLLVPPNNDDGAGAVDNPNKLLLGAALVPNRDPAGCGVGCGIAGAPPAIPILVLAPPKPKADDGVEAAGALPPNNDGVGAVGVAVAGIV